MEYHLSIAGQRSGPHSQFWIIDGIRDGRLKGDELTWRMGLEDWQPLRKIADFEGYWPPTPEMIAQAEAARALARSELDRPQPWLRFWARVLDYSLFLMSLSLLANLLFPGTALIHLQQLAMLHVPMDALSLLLYVPLEAWMLSRSGTTPGRALLRIQVRRLDGGLPGFRQALRRSFQVYVKGMALGLFLPIPASFTMAWWRLRLLQRGVTSWDEQNETRVEHGEPQVWRYLVLAGIVLGLAMMFIIALSMTPEMIEAMSRLPK
jgi:uncharacterized RDD family membrane protein YckC